MTERRLWVATHRAYVRHQESQEPFDFFLVMVEGDKAYQEDEWVNCAELGDPDLIRNPGGLWVNGADESVKVRLEALI